MSDKRTPIELKLDSSRIPSGTFIRSIQAFFGILKDVTDSVCGTRDAISWNVEVLSGSAVIRAIPVIDDEEDDRALTVSNAITNGLRIIEGGARRPEHFTERTLQHVHVLSRLSEPDGLRVYVYAANERNEISAVAAAHVDELLKWNVEDIGTIEGRLYILAKNKRQLEIKIRDATTGIAVICHIPDRLLDDAKDAFDRRVSVTGTVRYRKDGVPVSIEVRQEDGFFRFPLERELPPVEEIVGISGRS